MSGFWRRVWSGYVEALEFMVLAVMAVGTVVVAMLVAVLAAGFVAVLIGGGLPS